MYPSLMPYARSNQYSYTLHTPPATLPLFLEDVKDYLRDVPEDGAEDNKLTQFMVAVTKRAEEFTRRSFITQTWKLWMDEFPPLYGRSGIAEPWWDGVRQGAISSLRRYSPEVRFSKLPLQSVSHITTYDDADVGTVFPATEYFTDVEGGRVVLRTGRIWPVVLRVANGVEIEFVSGYGATGAMVPQPIIMGMYKTIAHWYENPMAAKAQEIPTEAEYLWTQFQLTSLSVVHNV